VSHFAYKFMARGARGSVSELAWPTPAGGQPGAWVQSAGPLELCRHGVHACRRDELAHWLHEELWIVELDGEQIEGIDCVVAARGRLVRHVDAWANGGAARFARAARDHAADAVAAIPEEQRPIPLKIVADSSAHLPAGSTALAAFCAAMAIAWIDGGTRFDDAGYRREKLWQSRFLADHLQLPADPQP